MVGILHQAVFNINLFVWLTDKKKEISVRVLMLWLPEVVAQSVLVDSFSCHLPRLYLRCRRESNSRLAEGTAHVVSEWQHLLDAGLVKNRAELARRVGVSRARVTQALRTGVGNSSAVL